MRACIFTADLGTVAARQDAWLGQLREWTGGGIDDMCFVGVRQTQPLDIGTVAFQPYCGAEQYQTVRLANAVFRLADAHVIPRSAVRLALHRTAPALVEAILACDPDVVLLDVGWGRYLKSRLEEEFHGPVYLSHAPEPSRRSRPAPSVPDSSTQVSIVLPTHNGSKYLRQSIQSCLSQSYRQLELIVVDDGSSEDIRAVVREFADPRLQYVRHEQNQGLPAALNTGFRLASGAYLTWTSDDNYYAPQAIERLTRALQRTPRIAFAYSSMYIVDEIGESTPRLQRALPASELVRQNVVGACFLYTRQVYRDIGEYDAEARLVEDYDYWIRVSKRFGMQRILDPLYYYRYHPQSLTSKHTRDDVARRVERVRQQNGISAPSLQ